MARGGEHHRTLTPAMWQGQFWGTLREVREDVFKDLARSDVFTEALKLAEETGTVAYLRPSQAVEVAAYHWAERWHLTAPWCRAAAADTVCQWATWPGGHESLEPALPVGGGWAAPPLRLEVAPYRPPVERWQDFRSRAEAAFNAALKSYRPEVEAHHEITTTDQRHLLWVIAAVVPTWPDRWDAPDYLALGEHFDVSERHIRETVEQLASILGLTISA